MRQTFKLAIVGFGLVGRRHAEAIAVASKATLAAIVDPDPEAAGAAIEAQCPYYSELGALLEAKAVDGVILATPNKLHVSQALVCVDAGLPTLVEKPIATSSEDAKRLVEASAAAGVPVMVGHHRRHNPIIATAKAAISSGQIGALRAVHAQCWLCKPDHYFDEAPWRTKPGAGPIAVNLVHDIDLLRYLCGEIASVRAISRPASRGYDNEDVAGALLDFANGAVGTVTVSDAIVSPWSWELTAGENPAYPATSQSCYLLGGSHGSLSLPDLRIWSNGTAPRDWWSPMNSAFLRAENADPLVRQIDHFAEVISGACQPIVSAEEGKKSLEVIEALQHAAKTGGMVKL
ncbi:MAG: Gfo/Idh/MocA family oxidoreductase [Pseudomonadota bacterium]